MIYDDNIDASPASGHPLSNAHIAKAIRGPEAPSSLDLSHLNLSEIPHDAVEQLAQLPNDDSIHRIALSNNHLRTLPMSFNLLWRLRYLNLRSNALYQFPEVLSDMESLEILDLSRNKIKAFPTTPGTLLNIRVLHLGKNRITALPAYFPYFKELNLLKIEHNPIEWPPPHVLNVMANSTDPLVAARWVNSIQGWIKDHLTRYGAPTTSGRGSNEEVDEMRFGGGEENGRYPAHDRTPSNESVISQYSNFSHSDAPDSPRDDRIINRIVNKLLPPENPDDYYSSDRSASADGHLTPLHGRNASLTYSKTQNGGGLQGKKSLPELRTIQLRPNERSKLRGRPPLPPSNASTENLSSSQLSVQNQSNLSKGSSSDTGHTIRPPRSMFRDEEHAASAENGSGQTQPPPMDGAQHSYFRRMSTLPASTISKAVPQALLVTIDAARGILFALSQVYSSLRHYIVFAINDRLSGVLNKVLDPASQYLARLITALDRFDVLCRSGTPPPAACRGVLEGCRDNIAVFFKVVGVLQIQLKVLAGSDDVRYTRTLLLMLYGSMAELSNSWMAIAPHMEEVKSLVRDARGTPTMASGSGGSTPMLQRSTQTIPENEEARTTPRQQQPPPIRPRNPPSSERRRPGGGSFSATDLKKGRDMPILRRDRDPSVGQAMGSVQPLQIRAPSAASKAKRSHLLQASGSGSPRIGYGNHSPSLSTSSHGHEPYNGVPVPNVALSSDKDKFVDASTLHAMQVSTDLALSVWKEMEDLFEAHGDGGESGGVIGRGYLMKARELIMALRSNIRAVLDGADGELYGAALWEGANTFSKDVTNVLTFVKSCIERRIPLDPSFLVDVRKLGNSTQEFATFLAFSSFAAGKPPPSPAPSSFTSPSAHTPGFASPALTPNISTPNFATPGFASPSLYDDRISAPNSASVNSAGFGTSDLMPPNGALWRSQSANVIGSPPPVRQQTTIGRGGGVGGGMAGGGHPVQRSGPAHPSLSNFKMPVSASRMRHGGGVVGYKDSD